MTALRGMHRTSKGELPSHRAVVIPSARMEKHVLGCATDHTLQVHVRLVVQALRGVSAAAEQMAGYGRVLLGSCTVCLRLPRSVIRVTSRFCVCGGGYGCIRIIRLDQCGWS